ncbi:hypothetical protein SEMRO_2646_G333550.1 [Seminavis robusta]|uniref:Uncharacterized protein n=1 Tax=Seminavis robusta TaxID=568900 RepID=A0A9N8F233_9STRA|nr:hypothetical protein SEMRO_2646_G333550.1 [Seminavis robusta]|eukprot:Sro2646_g333550.1 n/a (184) ;mRNA; r:2380-3020
MEANSIAAQAANTAKQMAEGKNKRQYDKTRGDRDAPGGRSNRSRNQNGRNNKRSNGTSNGNGNKTNQDKNWCNHSRCKNLQTKHLWKNCFWNPNNPRNKLGSDQGNDANKKTKTSHNGCIAMQVDDDTGTAFKEGPAPRAYDPEFKCLPMHERFAWLATKDMLDQSQVQHLWMRAELKRIAQD